MGRIDEYRHSLQALPREQWDPYLAKNSGLPGPRGNLELAMAVAEEAPSALIFRYAGEEDEYLAVCGAIGLGRLLGEGELAALTHLRALAGDSRWRVREGVAMGLQRLGDANPGRLLEVCRSWLEEDSWLVQRAVVVGLCEPRLLKGSVPVEDLLDVLDEVTGRLVSSPEAERRKDDFRVLRKALGYCWSVAIAAEPAAGYERFERWSAVDDFDARWVVRENLKKNRMRHADPDRWRSLQATAGRR